MSSSLNLALDGRRFEALVSPQDHNGCRLWFGSVDSWGYGRFGIGSRTTGTRKSEGAHRVAWMLANGPIPPGLSVLHRCDVPACVCVTHLFLGTTADNVNDARTKGRMRWLRGQEHPRARLTAEQVESIRSSTATNSALAKQFGVAPTTIHYARSGRNWSSQPRGSK